MISFLFGDAFCGQAKGHNIPRLFLFRQILFLIGRHQSICLHNIIIVSRFQERLQKSIMNVLDRLFFYLRAKVYEFCLWVSFQIDGLVGFGIPGGEDDENGEDGEDVD